MNRPEKGKVKTGSAGLDEILRGGFSARHLYPVQGAPGFGKTTLALQFLLAGARAEWLQMGQTRSVGDRPLVTLPELLKVTLPPAARRHGDEKRR